MGWHKKNCKRGRLLKGGKKTLSELVTFGTEQTNFTTNGRFGVGFYSDIVDNKTQHWQIFSVFFLYFFLF